MVFVGFPVSAPQCARIPLVKIMMVAPPIAASSTKRPTNAPAMGTQKLRP